jgi:shikimate kinase
MTDAVHCRLILVGMMGSGKTTTGRELSRRTGWPYHDNDALVQAATGRTARQLAADGVQAVRRAEAEALRYALRIPPPAIVASAAGVITDPAIRRDLAATRSVVWLRAPADVLTQRSMTGSHRPWLDGDAAEWLSSTAAEREPLYREVAALEVNTAGVAPTALAERIIEWLRAQPCAQPLGTSLAGVQEHE